MFVNCYICSKRILYCFGLIYIENEKLRGRQFIMFGETTDVAFKLSSLCMQCMLYKDVQWPGGRGKKFISAFFF